MEIATTLYAVAVIMVVICCLIHRVFTRRSKLIHENRQFPRLIHNGHCDKEDQVLFKESDVRFSECDHDFSARIESKLMLLDLLIKEAKRENDDLEKLLTEVHSLESQIRDVA